MFVILDAIGCIIAVLYWYYIKFPEKSEKENLTTKQEQKGFVGLLIKTPMIWNLVIAYFCIYAVNWGPGSRPI